MRILIIDEDSWNRDALQRHLPGHVTLATGSWLDALEALRGSFPQAVVMNVAVSGETGLEFLSRLVRVYPRQRFIAYGHPWGNGHGPPPPFWRRRQAVAFLREPLVPAELEGALAWAGAAPGSEEETFSLSESRL